MCGIFGRLNFSNTPIGECDFDIIAGAMVHRGPDGKGYWGEGNVALGMRRLSIIDLKTGNQPISNETDDLILVCNGEIYNYLEIRKKLISKGHRFSTSSDAEVILHLYEEKGRDAIHELNGMFAFALWDKKRKSLWLARDRLGIKPLFYSLTKDGISFSSDLNGLSKTVGAGLNFQALSDFLCFSFIPHWHTPYHDIERLLPGEQLLIENGVATRSIYWELPRYGVEGVPIKTIVEELKALVNESVNIQMRSDVPLGLFLSGGLDSSVVAAAVRKNKPTGPIYAITGVFEDKIGRDEKYASIVSDALDIYLQKINISPSLQFQKLDELLGCLDEPMGDTALIPTFVISQIAAKLGIKVMLSGAGGDELFGGYDRHLPNIVGSSAWFSSLPKPLRLSFGSILSLKNEAWKQRLGSPAKDFALSISGANFNLIEKMLVDETLFSKSVFSAENIYSDISSDQRNRLRADSVNYLPDNILSLTDKATMAASIEARVPLLDHNIVELATKLSKKQIFGGKNQKWILGELLDEKLSKQLLNRKKEGFNAPMVTWLIDHKQYIAENLINKRSKILNEFCNFNVITKYLGDDRLFRSSAHTFYSLYVLNSWLNFHHE